MQSKLRTQWKGPEDIKKISFSPHHRKIFKDYLSDEIGFGAYWRKLAKKKLKK